MVVPNEWLIYITYSYKDMKNEYDYEQESERSEYYYKRLTAEELSYKLGEQQGHTFPGRIFDSPLNQSSQKRIG